ncbi:MAG: AMP-binding protein [Solirubrobacterales bacterium]|nr:AMP-binding protein [Solirubrobacterales bacterium]
MWRDAVRRAPDRTLIEYFDATLTVAEVDRRSDALACALAELGVRGGDRVVVHMQNVPQFVVALLAIWKAGAIAVTASPMLREKELAALLADCGAAVILTLESLYEWIEPVRGAEHTVITTSELELAREARGPLAGVRRRRHEGTRDLSELIAAFDGRTPATPRLRARDVAMLVYTSGTTGPAKGAMNTHANVVFSAQTFRDWFPLAAEDRILGIAPLFHVTGLIGHIAACLLVPCRLLLGYRFDAAETVRMVERGGATATIAAITAFIALLEEPEADRDSFRTLRKVISGGAPIPPAVVERARRALGVEIRPIYGLTETTSPSHCTPPGVDPPVDPRSGALAAGVPVSSTHSRILDDDSAPLAPREVGEIAIAGPQVVPGYWGKPDETAHALPGGELRTGDLGFIDERGWFYVIDRKKDQINASGYKVWPREVEDELYGHEAVREAAVVGVPDSYRGETVKAFVSLKPDAAASPEELIDFCRARMAAYKYPREVEIIDELPKNAAGKILRRELRE